MSGEKVSYSTPPARQVNRSVEVLESAGTALAKGATSAAVDVAKVVGFVTIGAAAATVRAGVDQCRKEAERRRVEHQRLNTERREKGEALQKRATKSDNEFQKIIAAQNHTDKVNLTGADPQKSVKEIEAKLELLLEEAAVGEKANTLLKKVTENRGELARSPNLLRAIDKETDTLQKIADSALTQEVARKVLADRVEAFLKKKGYAQRDTFHSMKQHKGLISDFAVPGGGATARVSIAEDGRLGCRLYHELTTNEAQMSTEDEQAYKSREKRHCGALREMNKELNDFGFSFGKFCEPPAEKRRIATIVYENTSQIKSHTLSAQRSTTQNRQQ